MTIRPSKLPKIFMIIIFRYLLIVSVIKYNLLELHFNQPCNYNMNFSNLHVDIECDCINDTSYDDKSLFAIKVNKDRLRAEDFKSKWDKKHRANDCKTICLLKGNSLSQIVDENFEEVMSIYKTNFPLDSFAPSYKPFCALIKFTKPCGNVKKTPMKLNPYHFTFYKCDDFLVDYVQLIKITELHNV